MKDDKESVLNEYMKYRRLTNHTDASNDIEFHVNQFIQSSKKPLSDFNDVLLIDYLQKITPKYSTGMLNMIKSSYLKNFIKWYFTDWSSRFRNLDKILRTEKAGSSYKPEDMVSEVDFKRLISAEDSIFWKAFYSTLFYGACRPIEVCSLKWKDIEFENDSGAFITIYSNKNKSSFVKFVPLDVAFLLSKLKNNGSDYVFTDKAGLKPLSKKTAYYKIKILSKKVLGHSIDLYTLRHSIATIIYNKEGIKDDDIARQMGHTKSMKSKYVHNDKEKLKDFARKIYITSDEMPPERKNELERRVEILEDLVKQFIALHKKKRDALP